MKSENSISRTKSRTPLVVLSIIAVLLVGTITGCSAGGKNAGGDLLTQTLSVPLEEGTTTIVNINPGDGNLSVAGLPGSDQELASGTLQYLEKSGPPTWSVETSNGQTTFTVTANSEQSWSRMPWAPCNGATEWQIFLNSNLLSDITTYSDGGNIKLDLAGMAVSGAAAETGGGNIEIYLPDNSANLKVTAKTGAGNVNIEVGNGISGSSTIEARSGAGNVAVLVPSGIAVRIQTTTGNPVMDPQFSKVDETTYQTNGYESATDKIELVLNSGAGNVSVSIK